MALPKALGAVSKSYELSKSREPITASLPAPPNFPSAKGEGLLDSWSIYEKYQMAQIPNGLTLGGDIHCVSYVAGVCGLLCHDT